jgi:peptide/nickel transport system permease protein
MMTATPERKRNRTVQVIRTLVANPLSMAGIVLLVIMVIAAAWPVSLLPHDPYVADVSLRFIPPAWQPGGDVDYLLGTDALGRDMLSMIIHGARYSLVVVFSAMLLSLVIGVAAGLFAGYYRGRLDGAVMRLVDIQLAFPVLVLIIAAVAVLGPSLLNLVLVLGIAGWATYARIVRGSVLSIGEREFVLGARAVGASNLRIIMHHVLPNTITSIVIFATLELARLLLVEAALSFLGLGVQPPTPSWGSMIADGRQYLFSAWWAAAIPGLAIVLAVLAFNLLGDGLRDALDPLGRKR